MKHCMLSVAACTCFHIKLCGLLLQVLALAINSGLVAFPTGYDIAWSATGIYLWRPRCPESYIALGCIATSTNDPPSLTAMACLHHTLGIEAPLGQCLVLKRQQEANQDAGDIGHLAEDPGANVWCVDNAAATFTVTTAEEGTNPKGMLSYMNTCTFLYVVTQWDCPMHALVCAMHLVTPAAFDLKPGLNDMVFATGSLPW